jgi:hypothetical protein
MDSGGPVSLSDGLEVYFKIHMFNSSAAGVVQCLTSNASLRIHEDRIGKLVPEAGYRMWKLVPEAGYRIWKLVPEAGYPGAWEIPLSMVPSMDEQCIGVRSSEVSGIVDCSTSSQRRCTPTPQPPISAISSSHPFSPVRSFGVKNAWSCTSTTPIRLHSIIPLLLHRKASQ